MSAPKKPVPTNITEAAVTEATRPKTQEEIIEDLTATVSGLAKGQRDLQMAYDRLVSFVNDVVSEYDNRIMSIDNVAYLGFALHDGKQFEPTPENVLVIRDAMVASNANLADYRDTLKEAAEKAKAKAEKAEAKKAKVKAARDAKKGKTQSEPSDTAK